MAKPDDAENYYELKATGRRMYYTFSNDLSIIDLYVPYKTSSMDPFMIINPFYMPRWE